MTYPAALVWQFSNFKAQFHFNFLNIKVIIIIIIIIIIDLFQFGL